MNQIVFINESYIAQNSNICYNINDVENLAYFVENDFDIDFLYIGGKPEQTNNVAKLYKMYYKTKNVNYYNILVKGLQGRIILNKL